MNRALSVEYAAYASPVGRIFFASSPPAVLRVVNFCDTEDEFLRSLSSGGKPVKSELSFSSLFSSLDRYFSGEPVAFNVGYLLRGSPFQLAVWKELLRIPYGELRSYGEVATASGRPLAARAVGAACSKNPLPLIVPCHRVVGSGGSLSGYSAGEGAELKKKLLSIEGVCFD